MFVGEYNHNLDSKGRLAIPYRMRRELEDGAVVTRGVDGCLNLYTKEEWEKLAAKIAALPISDPKARRFARFFLAGAAELEFDKQGRVLVPPYLREFAKFGTEVVIAGVYNRIEIWNKEIWAKQSADLSPEADLEGLEI
ncbi:division/cell wall cluster transcriptional repressor MraZ [Candidatus Berkelbacteria bacterium]|nr:division/cell wall cluster transcriptional repressor MraZ [Candidatus Berkelbacteria bacterium]